MSSITSTKTENMFSKDMVSQITIQKTEVPVTVTLGPVTDRPAYNIATNVAFKF